MSEAYPAISAWGTAGRVNGVGCPIAPSSPQTEIDIVEIDREGFVDLADANTLLKAIEGTNRS